MRIGMNAFLLNSSMTTRAGAPIHGDDPKIAPDARNSDAPLVTGVDLGRFLTGPLSLKASRCLNGAWLIGEAGEQEGLRQRLSRDGSCFMQALPGNKKAARLREPPSRNTGSGPDQWA